MPSLDEPAEFNQFHADKNGFYELCQKGLAWTDICKLSLSATI